MENIVDTLRKVLAMCQSPVEEEAATAAATLERLLTKHNLTIADLEQRGATKPEIKENPHDLGKAAFKWKLDLAEGIAEFYYCAPIVDRKTKTVKFVGRPDNVESLTMLYAWVIEQIKDIAREERRKHYDSTGSHIDPLRWQVAFGEGATERLIERLREMKARQQEDVSRNELGDVTAMVLHHQAEVSDYLEAKYGYRTDGKKTKQQIKSDEWWENLKRERREEQEAKDVLRIQCEADGNMKLYWDAYPDERPDVKAEIEAARDKWLADERKKEERRARRREANGGRSYRPGPAIDWEKEEQSDTARSSGRNSADRVNLQPFIGGATERTGIGE